MGAPCPGPCSAGKPPVYPYKNVLKFGSKQPTPLLPWPEQSAGKLQRHEAGSLRQSVDAQHSQKSPTRSLPDAGPGQHAQPQARHSRQLGRPDAGSDAFTRMTLDQQGSSAASSSSSSSSSRSSSKSSSKSSSAGSDCSTSPSTSGPSLTSTSYTRGKGLLNRSFERVRSAFNNNGSPTPEIQPELELRLFKGQRQSVACDHTAPCMTEAALDQQWQESWVGVPRRRRARHGQGHSGTEAAPGCTDEHNPLLMHMQQRSEGTGGVMVNPLPAAMAVYSGPWVVVAGVVLGAALSGGAVAVAFGLASWITKSALVYGFAWKTATGAATLEGLCFGGVSSAKLQAARQQAASMQHQLVQMYAQASRQANTYAELVQAATLRHEDQVAGLIDLNERLTSVADSLRAENRGLHTALEQRTAEAAMHKEALLAERERGGCCTRADLHAMAAHQQRVLGALEALKSEMAGMKGQAGSWVGSDAVLATQQASTWPVGQALFV